MVDFSLPPLSASTPLPAGRAEGHLEVEGNLFEASAPAVGVIPAALSGEEPAG
ncbi:hypothetical protein GCM10009759_35910 [Kitasatospora saccharophila]|uniref:Uncharacterized protein n=1 Tax=Kitasatospora saccharophila TaxID=407973 RepID=A0ABN2X1F7_9ACTN